MTRLNSDDELYKLDENRNYYPNKGTIWQTLIEAIVALVILGFHLFLVVC